MSAPADTETRQGVRDREPTARGRKSSARESAPRSAPRSAPPRSAPRRGAKRTLMGTIRELPTYLRMFYGLFRDPRVPTVDKVLVGAAIAYLLAPVDLISDFIPFLGQVDDVFLLTTALKRLLRDAGRRVVAEHWDGDPRALSDMSLDRVIAAAAFFLPGRMRRRLRMIGRV